MNFYDFSRFLPDLLTPLTLTILLAVLSVLTGKNSPWKSRFAVSSVVILLVFSSPWTSYFLIKSMESRYPSQTVTSVAKTRFLVLLGGGLNLPYGQNDRVELGPSGDRILLTAELYLAGKVQNIIVSAGEYKHQGKVISEAAYTKKILTSMGIPDDRIYLETVSANTFENARESANLLRKLDASGERPFLVTSSFHMPRARALFCRNGIDPIAMSANHWISESSEINWGNWFFQAKNLTGSTRILREYIGILVYGVAGKVDLGALSHDESCGTPSNT